GVAVRTASRAAASSRARGRDMGLLLDVSAPATAGTAYHEPGKGWCQPPAGAGPTDGRRTPNRVNAQLGRNLPPKTKKGAGDAEPTRISREEACSLADGAGAGPTPPCRVNAESRRTPTTGTENVPLPRADLPARWPEGRSRRALWPWGP